MWAVWLISDHTLAWQCRSVLRTTSQVNRIQWKSVKFDPLPTVPKTPEPMVTKFGMGDDVGDPYTPMQNFITT